MGRLSLTEVVRFSTLSSVMRCLLRCVQFSAVARMFASVGWRVLRRGCVRLRRMANSVRPSGADVWANLRGAGNPLAALRGMAANSWVKLRRREDCCGNYGDPGC